MMQNACTELFHATSKLTTPITEPASSKVKAAEYLREML
jgi:hypothetical protein